MTTTTSSAPSASIQRASIDPAYDVVIVGARAAGASLAMLLARAGLSTLAVDRAPYGSDTLSTHSLSRAGVLQLSRWGVLDAVRAAGTPVANTVVFDYGGDRVEIAVPPRGDVDGLYSPRRTVLDTSLVDAAVTSGADVRHGVTFVDVRRRAGRVDGVVLDAGGTRGVVGAHLVVGADGMRSRVARLAGAQDLCREATGAASIYTYVTGLPADRIVNLYAPGRVVGVIPTNDDAAVVWVGMRPGRFAATARGDLAAAHGAEVARFPEMVDRLRGTERVAGFRAFPGAPGFLRAAAGPGWALVGDAGYFKDPVSAHGLTDALIGAELLADAVVEWRAGAATESAAMARYAARRDAMAAAMMPPVAVAASLPGDMGRLADAFRGMSAAMRAEWALVETELGALARA